jgi:hypothetical protein
MLYPSSHTLSLSCVPSLSRIYASLCCTFTCILNLPNWAWITCMPRKTKGLIPIQTNIVHASTQHLWSGVGQLDRRSIHFFMLSYKGQSRHWMTIPFSFAFTSFISQFFDFSVWDGISYTHPHTSEEKGSSYRYNYKVKKTDFQVHLLLSFKLKHFLHFHSTEFSFYDLPNHVKSWNACQWLLNLDIKNKSLIANKNLYKILLRVKISTGSELSNS